MPALPREPSLSREQRRALALFASVPYSIKEDLLVLTYGFDRAMIGGLVEAGLATAQREIVTSPGRATTEVLRITISDEGRRALEG